MNRKAEAVSTDEVRRHYEALSTRYEHGANAACNRAYAALLSDRLGTLDRVLEVGAGSGGLSGALPNKLKVKCDLTESMLRAANPDDVRACVSDAQALPFASESFGGVFSVNLLEHTPDRAAVLDEMARVLVPKGLCIAVTPNGNHEKLLDFLEKLRLKLPEGPHVFLTTHELHAAVSQRFHVVEHKAFLAFPAGPKRFVDAVDRVAAAVGIGGLFQYAVLKKK